MQLPVDLPQACGFSWGGNSAGRKLHIANMTRSQPQEEEKATKFFSFYISKQTGISLSKASPDTVDTQELPHRSVQPVVRQMPLVVRHKEHI